MEGGGSRVPEGKHVAAGKQQFERAGHVGLLRRSKQ